jgi:hypothetical protein
MTNKHCNSSQYFHSVYACLFPSFAGIYGHPTTVFIGHTRSSVPFGDARACPTAATGQICSKFEFEAQKQHDPHIVCGTRWCRWFRHSTASRRVAGSIGSLILPNPSSRTMALGTTQPLTRISSRHLPGGTGRPASEADDLTSMSSKCGRLDVPHRCGPPRPRTIFNLKYRISHIRSS